MLITSWRRLFVCVVASIAILVAYFAGTRVLVSVTDNVLVGMLIADAISIVVSALAIYAMRCNRQLHIPIGKYELLCAIIMFIGVWCAGTLASTWVGIHLSDTNAASYKNTIDTLGIAYVVVAVVIAPIVEELMFRGVLFGAFTQARIPVVIAAVISSATFAISHGTAMHLVPTFLLGMLCCLLYRATSKLWIPMCVHCTYNIVSVVVSKAQIEIPDMLLSSWFVLLIVIVVLGTLIAMFAYVESCAALADDDGDDAMHEVLDEMKE